MSDQPVHLWNRCDHCGMEPIVGSRFSCDTCPAGPRNDLCSACYELYLDGRLPHPASDHVVPLETPAQHSFLRHEGVSRKNFEGWNRIRAPECRSPSIPRGFLVRPEFRTAQGSTFAAYAFVATFAGHTFLLTALHVLDELIIARRLDTTLHNPHYSGEELPALIESVQLYDPLYTRWIFNELGTATDMLVLPEARTRVEEPESWRDIAAFRVTRAASLKPAPLAVADPAPGDPVWLVAASPGSARTVRAVCIESSDRAFIFRYDETRDLPERTSGAPIVDATGSVVGINTGMGWLDGSRYGNANPVRAVRTHLASASQDRSQCVVPSASSLTFVNPSRAK